MQISIIQGIFDPTLMQTATLAAQAQSDERLLMAFRDGDEDAFRSLYLRHRDRVWRFVQRLVRDPAQAEEVAQEIWLAVIAGRNAFAGRAKVTTWLFAIAHRCVARRLRGLLRNPESVVEDFEEVADVHQAGAPPDAVAQQDQDAARLHAGIARLPLAQREAFLLRAEGGLNIAQIALVVGCPAETVKTRLRYAYSKLRDALGSTA